MTKRTLYVTKILSDYLVTVSPCVSRKFSGRLREETEELVRMQIVLYLATGAEILARIGILTAMFGLCP